ncbi:hypothetical protein [Streptomyces sp. AN091965]|uniref:hypothetical protein n=1 Tax=Streptomyces sp. AN091965 TaxID=2927803 RepID=UPI001F613829|nr:hypothetical protein [Streptomyces sp. AN091965]MCI3928151.1 hypothetical protein [Streptomyces sp. AN091965]
MPELLLAAARPSWHAEAARFAATLTLGCAAYGVGCLTAAAVSLEDAGPGFLWPSYLLLGCASLTTFAALGHLVGRIWPSAAFTPAVCALGGFVAYGGVGQGYGLYVLSGGPTYTIDGTALSQRLLLAFVLVPLITLSGPVRVTRPAPTVEPLCDRGAQVCMRPEHRKYLPELTAMADRLARIPQGWIKQPAAFYEFGLRPTKWGDPGFDIAEGHVRPAAISMAAQVSTHSLGCTPPRDARRAWEASNRLDLWLEYRAMGVDPKAADAGLTWVLPLTSAFPIIWFTGSAWDWTDAAASHPGFWALAAGSIALGSAGLAWTPWRRYASRCRSREPC